MKAVILDVVKDEVVLRLAPDPKQEGGIILHSGQSYFPDPDQLPEKITLFINNVKFVDGTTNIVSREPWLVFLPPLATNQVVVLAYIIVDPRLKTLLFGHPVYRLVPHPLGEGLEDPPHVMARRGKSDIERPDWDPVVAVLEVDPEKALD